jgi:Fe-S cluster assembly iron-binding protein IscA
MVTVTSKAIKTMNEIVEQSKRGEPIRIFFAGFSCSGPSYMMGFDKKTENDVEQKVDGYTLIYEKGLEEELREAVIDSIDTPQGPGIVVRVKATGPSACASCGAGCH